jgi:hypothetical protein
MLISASYTAWLHIANNTMTLRLKKNISTFERAILYIEYCMSMFEAPNMQSDLISAFHIFHNHYTL